MNAVIVLAHPEAMSFNGHLARVAERALAKEGARVRLVDLYRAHFDPCEGPRHFQVRRCPERFDAQTEQRFSYERGLLPIDVAREIELIRWADVVLLQFPLWWFGLPAMLKGWMDRVFVYGGLYSSSKRHDTGICRNKKAVLCVTTGSSAKACAHNGIEGDTRLILWPALYSLRYLGFAVLRPFIIHGVRGGLEGPALEAQHAYLRSMEERYVAFLRLLDRAPLVPFNSVDDFDAEGQLMPGAPVYSPFVRHSPPSW
jgi:NAD(P)H dehydrogenase (quinone)